MKSRTTCLRPLRTPRAARRPAAGFTLIEINIVLLVMTIGLLGVLGLSPVGLRQGGLAVSDTVQALFADHVMGILDSQAAGLTNWSDWQQFNTKMLVGATLDNRPLVQGQEVTLRDYRGVKGQVIRYRLEFTSVDHPVDFAGSLRRATLRVLDREHGSIENGPLFCTDFVFMGPPPP